MDITSDDVDDTLADVPVIVHFAMPIADINGMVEGKYFDALVHGEWSDMYGRQAKFDKEALPKMVANTRLAIASAVTESGEVVGLPIDQRNHEHGDAAGWIVDVRLSPDGGCVQAKPQWNQEGVRLIKSKTMRHFSASVYPGSNVIVGGSLCNWPAQIHSDGRRAQRPIELGAPQDDAPLEIIMPSADVETTAFDQEAFAARIRSEVKDEVLTAMRELMATPAAAPAPNGEGKTDILDVLELSGASQSVVTALKQRLMDERASWQKMAEQQVEEMVAAVNKEARIAEFATKLTAGGKGIVRVLNVGNADDFKKWLMSLTKPQLDFAKNLLSSIQDGSGLVDMREFGTSAEKKGGDKPLPAEVAQGLNSGKLTIADLSSPILAPALGDINQYDLSRWGGAK